MIEDIFSGASLLERLGAATRWLYYLLHSDLTGSRRRKYGEFYEGKKGWKFSRKTHNAIYNSVIGTLTLLVVIVLLVFLSDNFY